MMKQTTIIIIFTLFMNMVGANSLTQHNQVKAPPEAKNNQGSLSDVKKDIIGDANGDGKVDPKDIEIIEEFIMTGEKLEGFNWNNADVNIDDKVDVADIVPIVNLIKESIQGKVETEFNKDITYIKKWGDGVIQGQNAGQSGQGFAIYNDFVFRFYHGGACNVYRMQDYETLDYYGTFDLGAKSFDDDVHVNSCQFDNEILEGNFPYLYVSRNRYQAVCFVEKITQNNGVFSSSLLQKISIPHTLLNKRYPGMDSFSYNLQAGDDGYLYLTAGTPIKTENQFLLVAKVRKPHISEGVLNQDGYREVTLTAADIFDDWEYHGIGYSYAKFPWQGAYIKNGLLFFSFGYPSSAYNKGFWVFNISSHELVNTIILNPLLAGNDEVEDIKWYNGYCYLVVNPNNYGYILSF